MTAPGWRMDYDPHVEIQVPLTRAALAALRRMAAAEMRTVENAAAKAVNDHLRAHGYFEPTKPRVKKPGGPAGGTP